MRRFAIFIIISLSLLIPGKAAEAHPQPLVFQTFTFNYTKETISLKYELGIDPVVVDDIYPLIDKNSDGVMTDEELNTFSGDYVLKNLEGRINSRDIKLKTLNQKTLNRNELLSLNDYIEINYEIVNPTILDNTSVYFKYTKRLLPADNSGDLISYGDNINGTNNLHLLSSNVDKSFIREDYQVDFSYNAKNQNATNSSTKKLSIIEALKSGDKFNFILIAGIATSILAGIIHSLTSTESRNHLFPFLKRKINTKKLLTISVSIALTQTVLAIILSGLMIIVYKAFQLSLPFSEQIIFILLVYLAVKLLIKAYLRFKYGEFENLVEVSDGNAIYPQDQSKVPKRNTESDVLWGILDGNLVLPFDVLLILIIPICFGHYSVGLLFLLITTISQTFTIYFVGKMASRQKINIKDEESLFMRVTTIYVPAVTGVTFAVIAAVFISF